MKHLKRFENSNEIKIGDYVILINTIRTGNIDLTKYGFKLNGLYKVIKHIDQSYPYQIEDINTGLTIYVREKQLRKAEPYEIEQDKYNL